MITSPAWKDKRYAVLGLARSGRATVEALLAAGAEVLAWDDNPEAWKAVRDEHRDLMDDRLFIDDFTDWTIFEFDALVLSPGVPLNTHPLAAAAREQDIPIIGDIELFAQARADLPPHKVVGITGTNGKSTTTALVHHILKTAGVPTTMGGNIGLPILEQEPLPEGGVYVLELSSYQIDLTYSLDCDVAVLLNITPDHLDRYDGDFTKYAAAKARLFEMQSPSSAAVSTERERCSDRFDNILERHSDRLGAAVVDGTTYMDTLDPWRQAAWPTLHGPHNLANAAAAIAVAHVLAISDDDIERGLQTYRGLPHRMERVAEISGVAYVNDSKGTNTAASAPALAAFDNIHWILGGLAKEPGLGECEAELPRVKAAYTIGKAGPDFAALLEGRVPVEKCETLDRAVTSAAAKAEAGDTVLLSPACASFDQYQDFEKRGEHFRALVEGLE
ncbi:UDP-N-acetylmuramoyl-L-alanine--D-glutamate ligase [Qipengyuania sp. GH38]|uniref:UDP-N-acetylmuramoyl-L-alanine--D-glutamate ligase n=1 Tax=Qipengyuania intermedia TaxID=2867244 RepID=UPI001C877A41|nr:UDP-N-acetylmuramoyl-L-alanine--D-glutamate ligase [Qipengyuania intermedia]MBX7514665.1 UDP-N-acetylmuramoyl-L-alanine--D-glutamate ligase [Qipengyuania intermedia]